MEPGRVVTGSVKAADLPSACRSRNRESRNLFWEIWGRICAVNGCRENRQFVCASQVTTGSARQPRPWSANASTSAPTRIEPSCAHQVQSAKDGASPAETRWGVVFCSPAGYGCSRLTATGCAQYAPKSVGLVVAAVVSGLLVGGLTVAGCQPCIAELREARSARPRSL